MDERTSERACRERAIREIAGHVRPRIIAIDQKCVHTALVMLVCIRPIYSASCLNNGITRASPHSFMILGALRDMEPRAVSNKRKHAEEEHRNCTSGANL